MALSLLVMVSNVPIYFFLNTVKRRMDNAVVGRVVFNEFMNERHNNREAASDNNAQKFISHGITAPVGMGFRALPWLLLRATRPL